MNNAQLAYNFAKKNNHSLFEQRRLKKYYDKSFEKFAKIKDKYRKQFRGKFGTKGN